MHLNRRSTHKVMKPQSCESPNFGNFGMWALWKGTKYTIWGKVGTSPKSGLWWVLWVRVCPWFILAPKMFKLYTNHLLFGFVQVRVSSWCLSFFLVPSQSSSIPLYPQSVASQGMCPNSLLFRCFQFRFRFESIKELGSASHGIRALVELDPLIGEFRWHQRRPISQYKRPWWKNPPKT